jgi:D-aminopeptidase
VSVIVAFNHNSGAHDAAMDLFAAALEEQQPARPPIAATPGWIGPYLEPETGISARLELAPEGVRLRYLSQPEMLDYRDVGAGRENDVRLQIDGERLRMDRPAENQTSLLAPCLAGTTTDLAGRYLCEELDAELTVIGTGDVYYGGFSGFLGNGRMELLEPIGLDVFALPCHRALDHSPPGDWTLVVRRNEHGAVAGLDVGCWLARRLTYRRAGTAATGSRERPTPSG